jgi:hypothetical protein
MSRRRQARERPGPARPLRVLKWATPAVVVVQGLLVAGGILPLGDAVLIALMAEIVLCGAALVLAAAAGGEYRRMRGEGAARSEALGAAARSALPSPVAKVALHEVRILHALWLAVRRREDVPPGALTFSCGRGQRPVFITIVVVSAAEVGVVHWLVPWDWARIALGLLGLYGIVWLAGLYQSFSRRPHYVHEGRLVLRCGMFGEVGLVLEEVESVSRSFRSWSMRSFAVHGEQDDAAEISLTPSGMTDVVISLRPGTEVLAKGRTLGSPDVHVACDDPAGFVEQVGRLAAAPEDDAAR